MTKFLPFNDEAAARARSRELMDTKRKPGNPDGDGKPYSTHERHALRVADDGSAILEITEDSGLAENERRALIADLPEKFIPLPKSDQI